MRFITPCLVVVVLATPCLHAAAAPPAFPPNPAHVNVTPLALPQAEQAPFGGDPTLLVRGEAPWQNAGRDPENRLRETYARAPVSEVSPSWFVLVWPEPIALSALRLTSNADDVKYYAFTGGAGENPALTPDSQWQRLRPEEQRRDGAAEQAVEAVLGIGQFERHAAIAPAISFTAASNCWPRST